MIIKLNRVVKVKFFVVIFPIEKNHFTKNLLNWISSQTYLFLSFFCVLVSVWWRYQKDFTPLTIQISLPNWNKSLIWWTLRKFTGAEIRYFIVHWMKKKKNSNHNLTFLMLNVSTLPENKNHIWTPLRFYHEVKLKEMPPYVRW